jgi:hypothetical protein
MRDLILLERRGMRLEDDVAEALEVLSREGIASVRSKEHPARLLVLDAYWHRAFQILVAENFEVT